MLNLEAVLKHRQELVAQRDRLDTDIKAINESLLDYLQEKGATSDQAGAWIVRRIDQNRSSLDKLALVEAGVLPEQIARATKVTTVSSIRVSVSEE